MQSPTPALGNRQPAIVASRIQLFERLARSLSQPMRGLKLRQVTAQAAEVDAKSTPKQTTLNFRTHFQCAYGEHLKLVGNTQELGNWDVGSAPSLNWTSGDAWTGQVALEKADDAQFKLVLLGHEGVVWEPGSDRKLMKPNGPEMSVHMAWGSEGLQDVVESPLQANATAQSDSAAEFDLLWKPTQTAQAAIISPPPSRPAKDRRSFDVTLEPEWGVLDIDPAQPSLDSELATDCESEGCSAADTIASRSEAAVKGLSATQGPGSLQTSDSTQSISSEPEGRGLVKKRKKNRGKRSFNVPPMPGSRQQGSSIGNLMSRAKNVVVGTLAATALSAIGAQGQDLLMGTVSIVAGAAILPKIAEARKGVLDFDPEQAILGMAVGIGETALKAAAIFKAAQQEFSQKTQALFTSTQQKVSDPLAEELEASDLAMMEDKLAEYVALLAQEAAEFAFKYAPSEEEIFEASAACRTMEREPVKRNEYMGNIVSTKLMNADKSACNA